MDSDRIAWEIYELDGELLHSGQATSMFYALDDVRRLTYRMRRDNVLVKLWPANDQPVTKTRPRLAFIEQAVGVPLARS